MSTFETYTTLFASSRFGPTFFKTLNFNRTAALVLPTLLPPDSISGWVFTSDVPRNIEDITLHAAEFIPCMSDLQPIHTSLCKEFEQGNRCVVMTILLPSGREDNVRFHFTKVISSEFVVVLMHG